MKPLRLALLILLLPCARPLAAADLEHEARAIIDNRCSPCHSHAANKMKAGLALDSRAGLLTGGDSGPALVPGDPDKSRMILAIRYTDDDLKMPPKGKRLPDAEVATLVAWVKAGAPWSDGNGGTGNGGAGKRTPGVITDEDRRWWSYQPLADPKPPAVADAGWCANDIDRFVRAKLDQSGLKPAPEAGRAQLIRRATFDLTGLPPTPEEIAAFVADHAPDAWPRLIDRLLASPRYGEHWARHWLDLVRYADSDGFRADDYRPTAWLYRDYVIRAFNDDKPYDRFVQEQLAGDELFPNDPQALVATGYLRHWAYEWNNRDVAGRWTDTLNDITDVTADVFMGMGLGCARCHDHKFDPLLQKDYFRLQGFFTALIPRDDLPAASAAERTTHAAAMVEWDAKTAAVRAQIATLEAPYREKAEREAVIRFPPETQALWHKPAGERLPLERQYVYLVERQVLHDQDHLNIKDGDKAKLIALQQELTALEKGRPAPLPLAFAATDLGPAAAPVRIPKKERLGEIAPGFPTILQEGPAALPPPGAATTNRRSALARWLTTADQPLSTRVIVNRVWQYHFGRGLVTTSSDFGHLGEIPSHPELLDWLARRFVNAGWSLKKLHREILLSATWRESAAHPDATAGQLKDPENRLLWRSGTRRLEAEAIRDTALAVSGELDLAAGGPGVDAGKPRRSIFGKVMRNSRDPLLEVFDTADAFTSLSSRNTTTTARQSLLMLNGDWALARAKAFAARLERELPGPDVVGRLKRAYSLAFAREPSADEIRILTAFLAAQQARVGDKGGGAAEATFIADRLPFRDGRGALLVPGSAQDRLEVAKLDDLPSGDFTIEAFVLVRSLYDSGDVRTIASRWSGDPKQAGWSFGVTGRKSRYKPQTLVLQLSHGGAETQAEALFSGLTVQVGKPYFVAASVRMADSGETGVTFFVKDLANDDEQMLRAGVAHRTFTSPSIAAPFTIGGCAAGEHHLWDGVIDDVRLSQGALRGEQLLLTSEAATDATVGYWRFEAQGGPFSDASGKGHQLSQRAVSAAAPDARRAAWIDLCHVLLNASELLYVD